MANAELNVILSADGKQLATTMAKAERDVQGLENELKDLPQAFDQVDKSVAKTASTFKQATAGSDKLTKSVKLSDAALKKLPQSSGAATQSLINLGRVAQDAPFGILGIANNINPLLESFQRLKKESGSSKAALKSLTSSLLGGGGLGLAVSVVSSLLIVFGDKLFGAGKNAKEADEAFKSMASHFADEATKLTSLVGIATNVNASYDDRRKALQAINQEYKSYLSNLDIEKVTAENVATAYNKIIDALLRQAVVKGLQEEITKVVEATAKKIISIEVAEKKRAQAVEAATKKVLKQETAADRAANAQRLQTNVISDGVIANQRAVTGVNALVESTNDYEAVLQRTKDDLNKQLAPLLTLTTNFEDLGISLDKTKGKTDKFYDNLIKRAKALEAFINKNTIRFANFEVDPEAPKEETIKKAQAFIQQALTARNTFTLKPQIAVENPVLVRGANLASQLAKEAEKLLKDFQSEIDKLTKRNPILIQAERVETTNRARGAEFFQALGIASADENAPKSLLTDTQKAAVNLANVMNSTVVPAFDDLFNAIKAGENPIKAFFQGLGQALQQLIQKLLQAVLQAALLSAITGGSTSFGSAFKSLIGFKAEGGPVFSGKPYVVGEKGPELFIPQGGGRIIPNNEMNSGLAGLQPAMQTVNVRGEVSGRNIRLVSARQGRYNARNV